MFSSNSRPFLIYMMSMSAFAVVCGVTIFLAGNDMMARRGTQIQPVSLTERRVVGVGMALVGLVGFAGSAISLWRQKS